MRAAPKYRQIIETLRREIAGAKVGEKLPSDMEFSSRFSTSRLTVIRAIRELAAVGLVERRPGSGTFVLGASTPRPHTFGLLIPDLGEGEILEPICQGMAKAGQSAHQELLWGNMPHGASKTQQALELCEYFISRKVSGVFFAPVELVPDKDDANSLIGSRLESAGIPIVLLNHCFLPFPARSRHDLVGIDNFREGFRMTECLHLAGCSQIAFVARPNSAPTIDARIAGWYHARLRRHIPTAPDALLSADPSDKAIVQQWFSKVCPQGIVCANDLTAALLMQTFSKLGIRIPDDVQIVGFDDVKYASLLPVPLTTLRQPCSEIGAGAVMVMLQRLANPAMMARDILLPGEIIFRESCHRAVPISQSS